MRLLILMAAGLSVANPASAAETYPTRNMPVQNPNAGSPSTCPPTSRYEAARRGGKLGRSLLSELPAADLYLSVYRKIGGCEAPIIVRYNVGGTSGRR